MAYRPGQRVEFIYTDDPYADLLPGDQGTVVSHDLQRHTVAMSWDNGSDLSMCLDAGDRIRPTGTNLATSVSKPSSTDGRSPSIGDCAKLHEEVFAAASHAGRQCADRWARDTFAYRSGNDVVATARRVLAGIERDDPATLAVLPKPTISSPVDFIEHYTGTTSEAAPPWDELTPAQQEDTLAAYLEGFSMAVASRTISHCITELGERGIAV